MGLPGRSKNIKSTTWELDLKTISCHFIGYPNKSKGYIFYCPERTTKYVDTRHAMFLECDMSSSSQDIDLEKIQTYDSTLITHDFIPTTMDAPHVEIVPLAENNDPLVENLGTEPIINENGEHLRK
jgi:hypothetical protein